MSISHKNIVATEKSDKWGMGRKEPQSSESALEVCKVSAAVAKYLLGKEAARFPTIYSRQLSFARAYTLQYI